MSAEPETVTAPAGVLAALLAPGPAAPVEPPTMLVMLAAARRQFGQLMFNERSAVTASPILTSQTVDTTAVPAMSTFAVAAAPATVTLANAATPAPPAIVQVKAATPQTSQSSVSVTYTSAQVAGSTNILAIGWNNTTSNITSVTDSAGNTYQLAVPTARGNGVSQAIYYGKNINAAAAGTNTVTTTFNAPTPYVDLRALEYSGLDPVNPFDVGTSASGTGTSASSGTVSTTAANALIFGAGITTGGFSAAGTNFTTRIITTPDADIAEDRIVTAAGPYNATAPVSGNWVMQVAAFKAAGAGGGDTTPPTATITPPSPGTTVSGTLIGSVSDIDAVFSPEGKKPAVASPAGSPSGIWPISTPAGPGFDFIVTDQAVTPWGSNTKAILAKKTLTSPIGNAEKWTFNMYLPKQSLTQDWQAGVLWEFHTDSSSGHHLALAAGLTNEVRFSDIRVQRLDPSKL
jgi:hypothetical protein